MKRAAAALLLLGCGADGLAHFEMSFQALALPVGEFQVAVITERANVDCTAVTKGCVKGAFPVSRFVLFSSRNSVGGGPYVVEAGYPLVA